jgi:LmbE family N-acetylglucosaminyl deacetylase
MRVLAIIARIDTRVKKMKILAIGAHPCEIELGSGGTVAKHVSAGDEVHFLVLTYGEKGGDKSERKLEAERSAELLKVKSLNFGEIEDTRVSNGIETIMKIEEFVDKIHPDRVYTQSVQDRHQDHRNTAYATFSAARRVAEVFSYESPDSYPNFVPQYYIQISDTMQTKIRALNLFNSQRPKRFLESDAIKGLALFRGYQVGIPYAEAFEVVRIIKL